MYVCDFVNCVTQKKTKKTAFTIIVCKHFVNLFSGKYIALSVYVVGLTIVLAVPTLQVFINNTDIHFCIYGIAVVFANTVVLCLVFVPKV